MGAGVSGDVGCAWDGRVWRVGYGDGSAAADDTGTGAKCVATSAVVCAGRQSAINIRNRNRETAAIRCGVWEASVGFVEDV